MKSRPPAIEAQELLLFCNSKSIIASGWENIIFEVFQSYNKYKLLHFCTAKII